MKKMLMVLLLTLMLCTGCTSTKQDGLDQSQSQTLLPDGPTYGTWPTPD